VFFDSPVYFCFLLLVVPVYWLLRHRQQNVLLLAASYLFYGWWDYRFLGLVILSTVVDYFCARWIDASTDDRRRKTLLVLSLALNLTFLGFFKYYDFFAQSLSDLLGTLGMDVSPRLLKILLPPGISFYTFQEVAYIVDVYKRRMRPAKSLVEYALFISLFPHLIAGPIQRPSHLLPQVEEPRRFDAKKVHDGVLLIVTGLFRKCVIADNCALLANAAFGGQFGAPSILTILIGAYAFAWQIYGDFSGYSDIARGSAQLLGFHFMVNFRQPYLSTSLQDFWRRWHISLSTWLRDYLYIPLGGNRDGETRTQRNLMLTMLIGGLWHGANWTFVIWGALHGAGLAIARRFTSRDANAAEPALTFGQRLLRRIALFHLVCLAWVFFRAESLPASARFLSGVTTYQWQASYLPAAFLLIAAAVPLLLIDLRLERRNEEYPFEHGTAIQQYVSLTIAVISLLFFSASSVSAFIYFQF
jgi:alginate O-acetyltransferase complex protein AlgI